MDLCVAGDFFDILLSDTTTQECSGLDGGVVDGEVFCREGLQLGS